jgi:hypothetical protein
MSAPPHDLLPELAFEPNRRWYNEYLTMLTAANAAIAGQTRLAQHVHALEQELEAARLDVTHRDELGSADRARIGAELRARLDAIMQELRRRHWPDGDMP